MRDYRMLSPEQLFNWAENNTAIMRLRTDRDVLPGGREGVRELFLVSVALGDSVARDSVQQLLEQGKDAWLAHAPKSDSGQDT